MTFACSDLELLGCFAAVFFTLAGSNFLSRAEGLFSKISSFVVSFSTTGFLAAFFWGEGDFQQRC